MACMVSDIHSERLNTARVHSTHSLHPHPPPPALTLYSTSPSTLSISSMKYCRLEDEQQAIQPDPNSSVGFSFARSWSTNHRSHL